MVELGANAVMVQHPHCLGAYENYHGGHIVYGQGALVMDEAIYRNLRSFHEGFLVKLTVAKGTRSKMELLPFEQSDPVPGARKMRPEQEQTFRRAVEDRSKAVIDPAFVEAEWLKFCEKEKHSYLSGLLGHNRVLTKLNSSGLLTKNLYSRRQLLGVRNLVSCETHREALETIFNHGLI
jgi:poly-gamma-glutamate synthesis protein (capsule biosynthesis protein)